MYRTMAGMTPLPSDVTPDRLTMVLRRAGVLAGGKVIDVAAESSRDMPISRVTRLRLTYGPGADGAPSHIFFKTEREDIDERVRELGRKEVGFYQVVAAGTPAGLLPRCYDGVADPGRPWQLMLEDLSASHETLGEWPLPPSLERFQAVVDAHARFHAAWWDDERLGVSVGAFADEAGVFDRQLATFEKDFAAFVDRLGDRLSTDRKRVYERLFAAAPRLLDRYRSHRNLTIIHGDAHVWNALLPRTLAADDVRLIDWDAWHVDTATDDLAYMIAVHCYPDWRRRHERPMLRRYHNALVAGGVRDYSFDALSQDYRLSALWQIVTPMWQAQHGIGAWVWWNHLDRIMSAVHDLGCLDLLD
jgi:thiamine kinase-like enzyme